MIPFLKPNVVTIDAYEKYISQIDESRIYSNFGPLNTQFEQRIKKEFFGESGSLTTINNATMGLILSINEFKNKAGKYAIMPSFTFSATPLAAIWSGLIPYFVDIDENSWTMDREKLQEALQQLGEQVAVVIPYATFGTCIDITFYNELQEQGIPVVIDAAPSFGSMHNNNQFGHGFNGAMVFSFHATKPFGIGEGGLVYSKNKDAIQNIRAASNFGYMGSRESINLGINAKLSEYHAAIGLATLDVFPEKLNERQGIYQLYLNQIEHFELESKGWRVQHTEGSFPPQFFPILCPKGENNRDIIERLKRHGISAAAYFSPACHQQKQFKEYPNSSLNVTNEISERIISLPLWENMDVDVVKRVIIALRDEGSKLTGPSGIKDDADIPLFV
ncbi:DegT/DnrJ/EryC1/StrS family aminotransferase [Bacillus sp. T33-2]|uniref:DegT/DnrJ/EryC1/StrS family aminotransferase n=1 Tax=Bacillus sp. T33-2 TaxID=2054168 RepID=UPI000C783A71|nr:aminotransferase class I/II-fold pyridoxal phosphate-dependent enzyme [Bacillus sp. T33-2]PLR90844.1 aminotransferase DegT [Bacillus sp. T33-2]